MTERCSPLSLELVQCIVFHRELVRGWYMREFSSVVLCRMFSNKLSSWSNCPIHHPLDKTACCKDEFDLTFRRNPSHHASEQD